MLLTYTNPVHPGYFADPFVLRARDGYVAYGTGSMREGRAFEVLRSPDLVHWTSVGGALEPLGDAWATDYWAPEVAHADGRWFMYYSVGTEDRGHRLRVAVADEPAGPFRDAGLVLTPDERFAIDPHPFRDGAGNWWLFYARDVLEGERPGTVLAVDRMLGMTRLEGRPRTLLRATADWQRFLPDRPMYGAVYDWHTLEGPFVREREGRFWLFYSGGNWQGRDYGVGWAVADAPDGPYAEHVQGSSVLTTRPGEVLGPGHNSIVAGPDGADWLVYHAWDPDLTVRRMCIDRLRWGPDGPEPSGPTTGPQPGPG